MALASLDVDRSFTSFCFLPSSMPLVFHINVNTSIERARTFSTNAFCASSVISLRRSSVSTLDSSPMASVTSKEASFFSGANLVPRFPSPESRG